MKTTTNAIEPLESRIAPASVFTFTDTDGDKVTVSTSKGTNNDLLLALTFNTAADVPRQLQTIDLSLNPVFAGTNLIVTATRVGPTGDGLTAVGFIDATGSNGGSGIDLGTVTIDGDLGRIQAGSGSPGKISVKALTVGSLGLLGTTTQAGGNLDSGYSGIGGPVTVKTDFAAGTFIIFDAGPALPTGALSVGGNLAGVFAAGAIKSVFIGGDLAGGQVNGDNVGSIKVLGSILGGSGVAAGRIFTDDIGSLFIGGDVRAGTSIDSGVIEVSGTVKTLTIRGSIIADATAASFSGQLRVDDVGTLIVGGSVQSAKADAGNINADNVTTLAIGGDLRGGKIEALNVGSFSVGGSMIGAGFLESGSFLASVTKKIFVGGDLRAGTGGRSALIDCDTLATSTITVRGSLLADAGSGNNSAEIQVGNAAKIFVGGDVIGGGTTGIETGTGGISAGAVKSLFIGGVLQGGPGEDSGKIEASDVGTLRVGAIIGGGDRESGAITATSIGTLLVAGDVRGGSDPDAGVIFVENLGSLDIRGHLIGSSADAVTAIPVVAEGGQIEIGGNVTRLSIAGDIRAGAGDNSAIIAIAGNAGTMSIGGSLVGGSDAAGSTGGARVFVAGAISSFTLGGSIIGGGTDSAKLITSTGIKALRIAGDVIGGAGERSGVVNGNDGQLGSFTLGGSIRGGEGDDSGIVTLGNRTSGLPLAKVVVRGGILGGAGNRSGQLNVQEHIGPVTIDGSILGSTGSDSGRLKLTDQVSFSGSAIFVVGAVTLRGDLRGGFGSGSGVISISGDLVKTLTVGGQVAGGAGNDSGFIDVEAFAPSVRIGGSVIGGGGSGSGRLELDDAGTLTVRGDLRGGNLQNAGRIETEAIGFFSIGGSIVGGNNTTSIIEANGIATFNVGGSITGSAAFPVRVESRPFESLDPDPPLRFAFGKITVAGSVSFARIHGGFTSSDGFSDSDVQIGAVIVRGNWIASDLVAAAQAGAGGRFGDGNDFLTANLTDDPDIFARIASVTIGGRVRGTAGGGDSFGIIAQEIGALSIAGEKVALAVGRSNDNIQLAATNDVKLVEL